MRRVRVLLRGETLEEDQGHPTSLSLPPGSRRPDLALRAGTKAMRLAGEIADGVILNWCPPERVPFARARIAEGAEAAERDPASVTVAVYVRAWVGPEETEAMSALRAMAGRYASYRAYRRQFDEVGLGPQAAVARAGAPCRAPGGRARGPGSGRLRGGG